MRKIKPNRMYTLEEYLEFEERAEDKHEYIAGRIYPLETAMAGGEMAHAQLTINLGALMHSRLPKGCIGLSSDMKIRIEEVDINTYADLTIVCGEPQFVPHPKGKRLLLLNPKVIFEVLSESTEPYDRGEKWKSYQSIPTLTNYLLVYSDQHFIEHYERTADGWRYTHSLGLEDKVQIENLKTTLLLAEVYRDVSLAPRYDRRRFTIIES
jgi:Uma2 family endonuclease